LIIEILVIVSDLDIRISDLTIIKINKVLQTAEIFVDVL